MAILEFLLVCCLLLSGNNAQGGKLHPQWCSFISDLCRRFENSPGEISLLHIHCEYSIEEPFLHLLPPILIWAPVEQLKVVTEFVCPKCDSSSLLCGYDWMNGVGRDRCEPRKIHGRDGVVILVGRVYKCVKMGHEIIGYHPGILRQIKPSLVPFRLWSRTGFTYELMSDIEAMVVSGVSISKIAASLATAAIGQYSNRKNRYADLKGSLSDFPTYEEWCSFLPTIAPSRHAIAGCFLASFWEKSILYDKHMQYTSITDEDSWFSCDHTFASAGKAK